MRRKEWEVTDNAKINEIISACTCCRLGFNDDGRVYIVPLNFGYEEKNGCKVFYFHSATEGRKIDLIQKTHYACFEMDTNYKLHVGETACNYSAGFQSVIGAGKVDMILNRTEKERALQSIMYHNTRKADWDFSNKNLNAVAIFKLEVEELSCKEHL